MIPTWQQNQPDRSPLRQMACDEQETARGRPGAASNWRWCQCECGTSGTWTAHRLKGGVHQLADARANTRKHGGPETREYQSGTLCTNAARVSSRPLTRVGRSGALVWPRKGASSISDMGPRPPGTSLDRKDGKKGYTRRTVDGPRAAPADGKSQQRQDGHPTANP